MKLVVAEKPSVGREIARVLGCRERGEGWLKGSDYVVTWAFGHLVTLMEPDELEERYKKWRQEDLPILPESIPTKIIPKTKAQYVIITKWMMAPEIERIICATDAGREGELIFGLIYDKAGCTKPVDRLWISSLTDAAIRDGFAALKPRAHYNGLYLSAQCRSQSDWLVGMNASRAYTLSYHAHLSLGRVQTPTLAILVRRALEIRSFMPEEYFTLTASFGDYKGTWFDPNIPEEKRSGRIADKPQADALAKKVRGQQATVLTMEREKKRELPPPLFDLTSLQREANKVLGFTADKTLKTAQSLYEQHKAITYPRTDSRYLSNDMAGVVEKTMQAMARHFGDAVALTLGRESGPKALSRVFDDAKVSDHHAIIPTPQPVDPKALPPAERALYEMVVKRFVASHCAAYEFTAAKVVTSAAGEHFKSTGREVLQMGWKQLYQADDKEQEAALPGLRPGDTRKVASAAVKKETTKPPAQHTDASLLAGMENAGREVEDEALREAMKGSGLGTPATRAAIIERLIQVGYAGRHAKALVATPKGEQLIAVAPEEIASPEMTGRWEQALEEIARGKRDTQRFMQGIRKLTEFVVESAKTVNPDVHFEREIKGRGGKVRPAVKTLPAVVCPLCAGGVVETEKAFGCANWRDGCPFTLWKDSLTRVGGPKLTATIVSRVLKGGSVRGSTGEVTLKDGRLAFARAGDPRPAVSFSVRYEKKQTT